MKSSKLKSKTKRRDSADYTDIVKMIKPLKSLPFNITMVTYGRSGSGKTTFAATFPKPMLLLNIKEDGTDSVSDVKGVESVRINNWDEFEQIYWFLKSGKHSFKSVVIDAVTELQEMAIEKYKEEENKSGDEVMSQRAWGIVGGKMKKWLIEYRDLVTTGTVEAVNFICHDRTHGGEDGTDGQLDPEVGPRLMPSVSSHLCGAVKVIGYTFIKEVKQKDPTKKQKETEVEYRMRVGPHPYYTTKVRKPKSSRVPASLMNPTYEKIVSIMRGEYEPKSKSTKSK